MPYDIEMIRNNIKKAVSGKFVDPDEFRPDKAKDGNPIKYRFFILPPIKAGDVLRTGESAQSMDNFFLANGNHWINERPHACPRVWDSTDCAICQYGFDLLKECKDQKLGEDRKKLIVQQWMPNTYYMVNIFFTNWKGNPEDLRGKVKYYNAPKTCLDKWMATLMRDDKGDDEDPDAFGVFFDENAAFCFELVVTKDGRTNGYKSSGFIKNNGNSVPMIMNEDRSPNKKKIEALLQQRINLFAKVETPNCAKIKRLANTMISGDDGGDGGGFDDDETTQPPPAVPTPTATAPSKPVAKATEKPPAAAAVTEEKKQAKPVQAKPVAKKTAEKVAEKAAPSPGDDDDDDVVTQADQANLLDNDDDIAGDDIDALLSQLDD